MVFFLKLDYQFCGCNMQTFIEIQIQMVLLVFLRYRVSSADNLTGPAAFFAQDSSGPTSKIPSSVLGIESYMELRYPLQVFYCVCHSSERDHRGTGCS